MNDLIRIVPGQRQGDGPQLATGTKVLLSHGTELPGVTKVVLTAEAGDVWKAELTMFCMPPDEVYAALAEPKPSRFIRIWRRMWGIS